MQVKAHWLLMIGCLRAVNEMIQEESFQGKEPVILVIAFPLDQIHELLILHGQHYFIIFHQIQVILKSNHSRLPKFLVLLN